MVRQSESTVNATPALAVAAQGHHTPCTSPCSYNIHSDLAVATSVTHTATRPVWWGNAHCRCPHFHETASGPSAGSTPGASTYPERSLQSNLPHVYAAVVTGGAEHLAEPLPDGDGPKRSLCSLARICLARHTQTRTPCVSRQNTYSTDPEQRQIVFTRARVRILDTLKVLIDGVAPPCAGQGVGLPYVACVCRCLC